MNVITIAGRLGGNAETRYTANGGAVANFSLACDVGYGDSKHTEWFRCAIWGKRAESGLIQYLTKGQQVTVSGELSTREWNDKDGNLKTSLEVRVAEVALQGGRADQPRDDVGARAPTGTPRRQMSPSDGDFNDDIPF